MIRNNITTMKLLYKIVTRGENRFVYLCNDGLLMDAEEMWSWMRETRDSAPDLYAQLVVAYCELRFPHSPTGKS